MTINREIVVKSDDGTIITAAPLIAEVRRAYKDIANLSITIGAVSMTVNQFMAFLAGFADMFTAEDIAAAKIAKPPV